MSNLMLPWWK